MSDNQELKEAGRDYTVAYAMHYAAKDLHEAINLYMDIITAYPDTREAEYSKTQIQNIVKTVVPEQVLFNAQIDLALIYLNQEKDNAAIQVQIKPKPAAVPDK